MNKKYTIYSYLLLLSIIAIVSCKDEKGKYHSVSERIIAEQEDYVDHKRIEDIDSLSFVLIHSENKNFYITKRSSKIVSYKCTECHTENLNTLQKGLKKNQKKSHWNIKIDHANSDIMACNTCHSENNMNILHSINGKDISFDTSFNLCGQCHSKELKDWTGGAHGKQVDGWKKPRISKTCTDCHNPHSPSIKKRWPARLTKKQ